MSNGKKCEFDTNQAPGRLAEKAPKDESGARLPPRTRLNSLV